MKRIAAAFLAVLLGSGLLLAAPQHQSATISVTVSSTHAITVAWVASVSTGVTGYFVYRSTINGGPYTKIAPLVTILKYVERPGTNGAISGATYFYVVTATDGTTESAFSNQASGTMP